MGQAGAFLGRGVRMAAGQGDGCWWGKSISEVLVWLGTCAWGGCSLSGEKGSDSGLQRNICRASMRKWGEAV